jgi:guanylate kinase
MVENPIFNDSAWKIIENSGLQMTPENLAKAGLFDYYNFKQNPDIPLLWSKKTLETIGSEFVLVICAPSSMGKDATIRLLQEQHPELFKLIINTTDNPTHKNKPEYNYVTPKKFTEMFKKNDFLEKNPPPVRGIARYGVTFNGVNETLLQVPIPILRITYDAVPEMQQKLYPHQIVSVGIIFQTSFKDYVDFMKKNRTDNVDDRFRMSKKELENMCRLDHLIMNPLDPSGEPIQATIAILKLVEKLRSLTN